MIRSSMKRDLTHIFTKITVEFITSILLFLVVVIFFILLEGVLIPEDLVLLNLIFEELGYPLPTGGTRGAVEEDGRILVGEVGHGGGGGETARKSTKKQRWAAAQVGGGGGAGVEGPRGRRVGGGGGGRWRWRWRRRVSVKRFGKGMGDGTG
jgi:uncharacterized membrane protein YgcG